MQLYGQAAMLEMVVDKLPEIARSVSEPLSKTEKIILFGEGGATSMAGTLPVPCSKPSRL